MKKKPAGLPINEQETVICIERITGIAHIATSDTRMMTKLDKKYARKEEHFNEDGVTEVMYEVPETFIQFATKRRQPTYTEEQLKKCRERLNKQRK